ncbi:hypothetical protein GCM10010497_30170 [Streptomyces cinereoruber]|uniref:Uncharacterized protein n=1 Tax=Streptomyces cinereoruber TaxID=67260 RepID=A0AAV4KL34_9ACTN|nr:hypothetical protein GCM10010497_30170 [Streptomyces cinereoruber]
MVGVVEEEDQVPEAYQGVGALPRTGEVSGVAVHVTDHMDSHGATLGGAPGAGPGIGRRAGSNPPTCGYFRVGKRVDYCSRSTATRV